MLSNSLDQLSAVTVGSTPANKPILAQPNDIGTASTTSVGPHIPVETAVPPPKPARNREAIASSNLPAADSIPPAAEEAQQ